MDNILKKVATFIELENKSLTEELLIQAIGQLNLRLNNEQVAKHIEFLQGLLSQVSISLTNTKQETQNMKLKYDIDNFFYNDGTLLKDTVEIISTFRLSLLSELQKRSLMENMGSLELTRLYNAIIFVFDDAIRNTTQNFNLENQKVIDTIQQEILELAAPIVPIKDGIAVLPLIGDISESRATYITNNVIPKVTQLNINMLVIDFSGILQFDTHVAQQIFQIRDILSLLGVQPIVTGIRPIVAQTAVQLGINVKDLQTYATVKQFLDVIENKDEQLYNQEEGRSH